MQRQRFNFLNAESWRQAERIRAITKYCHVAKEMNPNSYKALRQIKNFAGLGGSSKYRTDQLFPDGFDINLHPCYVKLHGLSELDLKTVDTRMDETNREYFMCPFRLILTMSKTDTPEYVELTYYNFELSDGGVEFCHKIPAILVIDFPREYLSNPDDVEGFYDAAFSFAITPNPVINYETGPVTMHGPVPARFVPLQKDTTQILQFRMPPSSNPVIDLAEMFDMDPDTGFFVKKRT